MSYYQNKFVPKVRQFTVDDEGEQLIFYIRKPKAIEMIRRGEEMKKRKDEDSEVINKELIGKYVVYEDGQPITDDDVNGILDMESTAFAKFSEKLTEMISGKKTDVAGEIKNV